MSSTTAFFDATNRGAARSRSTLAYTILCIEGVTNVMLGSDFITVTVDDDADWLTVKSQVFAAITEAYASSEPILKPEQESMSMEEPILPGDEETVELIKEIIDMRIRPTVMEDGGDVEFIRFDSDRVVWLRMMGSCSGCPSSGATLKHGIQNMIMHYVPEVNGVEEWVDEKLQTVSQAALDQLEQKLAATKDEKSA
jgi:Fe-S cluster biogenesis protein NfuA